MPKMKIVEAINAALREEMENDERVFVMGEDVGIYGGIFGVTNGLYDQFGSGRVIDTPISESAIAGAAVGAAVTGMRPVAEIMFIDFLTLAMDQLANQAAKMCYMFGGKVNVPMVLRVPAGTGRSAAAQHSQSLEAWVMHIPGLKVVYPSTPYDAKGLLKSAIRDDNPVVFIEHKITYPLLGEVPEGDYIVPIGVADIKREGADVTVIATGRMLHYSLEAAEKLQSEGISVEIVDPRTLQPIDYDTIIASVAKTSRLAIVQEACRTAGPGCEFVATVQERAFDYLDAPIIQIAGLDVPIPFNPNLEKAVVPSVEQIVDKVKTLF